MPEIKLPNRLVFSELYIIEPDKNQTLEHKFLSYSESLDKKYDVVITHF